MKVVCICLVLIAAVADAGRLKRAVTDISVTSSGSGVIELNGYGDSIGLICKSTDDDADSVAGVECSNGYQYFEKSSLSSTLQSDTEWTIDLSCSDDDSSLNDCTRSNLGGFSNCGTFVGCA